MRFAAVSRVRWRRMPGAGAGALVEVALGEPIDRAADDYGDKQIRRDRLNGGP